MEEQAVPFALGVLLTVLGAISSWLVQRRLREFAGLRAGAGTAAPVAALPASAGPAAVPTGPAASGGVDSGGAGGAHTSPHGQSVIGGWAADAAQAFVVGFAPLAGGVTLVDKPGDSVVLLYTGATVVSWILFARVLYASPDQYMRRSWFGVSIVTWAGILLNGTLAAVVQFL